MSTRVQPGTMLLRQGTALPRALGVTGENYSDGWRTLHAVDRFSLERKVRDLGWSFFFIAGRMRTTVVGRGEGSIRRAVSQVAKRSRAKDFNCLELTVIASGRFLGIPFVSLSAYSYHIQEGQTAPSIQAKAKSASAQ